MAQACLEALYRARDNGGARLGVSAGRARRPRIPAGPGRAVRNIRDNSLRAHPSDGLHGPGIAGARGFLCTGGIHSGGSGQRFQLAASAGGCRRDSRHGADIAGRGRVYPAGSKAIIWRWRRWQSGSLSGRALGFSRSPARRTASPGCRRLRCSAC